MEKNLYVRLQRHRKIIQFVLTMKVTFILSVLFALQAHAGVYSQQVRMSMELERASIKQIINEIKLHTEYSFVYSDADLEGIENRDVLFKDATIENILSSCLKGTALKFSIEEKTIVIWKEMARLNNKVVEKIIKGLVTDRQGIPLPGATIMLKGTTLGVVSDTAGQFQISLPESGKHVLVFSFVGMKRQEIPVTDKDFIRVMLEEDNENLDDVVVTGYGKRSKSSYAGAVQSITSEELVATGATSLIEGLKGLVPGLEIRQSGLIGSAPVIKIRGCNRLEESTITGTASPLFVIDGFIMNDMSCYNMLNPKDIENMTILKDAEAMSLYGSRGANGVIVITTKKGKNERMQVKLGAAFGFVDLGKDRFDVMSSRETLDWERLLYANYYDLAVDDPKVLEFRPEGMLDNTTDYYDETLQGSWNGDVNLSASGGNARTQFFIQGSFTQQSGVVKKNDMQRFGMTANLQHRASEKVSIAFSTNAYRTEIKNRMMADQLFEDIQKTSPLAGAYNPKTGELFDGTQADFQKTVGNPLYNYSLNHDENVNFRFASNASVDIKLLPYLSWNSQFGYEATRANSNSYTDPRTQKSEYFSNDGTILETRTAQNSYSWRSMLSLNKFWENHSLTGFASVEYQYEDYDYLQASGSISEPVLIENLSSVKKVTPEKSMEKSNFMGVVFQAEYGFRGKYYVSGSVRTDGSSRFGGNNKWGTFGSVGLAYNVKNEDFLKDKDWMDILKLRATYGKVGNANFGSSFSHYTVYKNAQYNYADKYPTYSMDHYKNENLKWETTDVYNVGADFGFFHDRFSGNIDYYFKKTTGLLENMSLPLSSGVGSQMQNTASVQNQGVEISLQSQNIKREFRWSTNFNISLNRNKVLKLRDGLDEIDDFTFYCRVGKTMECYYLQEWAGVDPDNGNPLWYDEEGNTTDDYYSARKVFVSREDKYRGGFNNYFSWKGLHLGVNILFANTSMLDNMAMSYTETDGANFGGAYFKDAAKDYWQKPGDLVSRPRPMRYGNNSANESSTRYMISGFFARIQSINLSYDLPDKWMGKFLKSATAYFRGNGLWYIYTDHQMLDPDAKSGMMSILSKGVSVPTGRNFQFGIDLVF